jgi:hypothetical protein
VYPVVGQATSPVWAMHAVASNGDSGSGAQNELAAQSAASTATDAVHARVFSPHEEGGSIEEGAGGQLPPCAVDAVAVIVMVVPRHVGGAAIVVHFPGVNDVEKHPVVLQLPGPPDVTAPPSVTVLAVHSMS